MFPTSPSVLFMSPYLNTTISLALALNLPWYLDFPSPKLLKMIKMEKRKNSQTLYVPAQALEWVFCLIRLIMHHLLLDGVSCKGWGLLPVPYPWLVYSACLKIESWAVFGSVWKPIKRDFCDFWRAGRPRGGWLQVGSASNHVHNITQCI